MFSETAVQEKTLRHIPPPIFKHMLPCQTTGESLKQVLLFPLLFWAYYRYYRQAVSRLVSAYIAWSWSVVAIQALLCPGQRYTSEIHISQEDQIRLQALEAQSATEEDVKGYHAHVEFTGGPF